MLKLFICYVRVVCVEKNIETEGNLNVCQKINNVKVLTNMDIDFRTSACTLVFFASLLDVKLMI